MDLERLFYDTYAEGAFDGADPDDVYDVADALGSGIGSALREDVLDRYARHQATATMTKALEAQDAAAATGSRAEVADMSRALGLDPSDVSGMFMNAATGDFLGLDKMFADYYGR